MPKLSKPKITNLEQAVQAFWKLQRQWHGHDTGTRYTVADTNLVLSHPQIVASKSQELRKQAWAFQNEIINRPRRKKRSSGEVILPLTRKQ